LAARRALETEVYKFAPGDGDLDVWACGDELGNFAYEFTTFPLLGF
jgi:hypothetical protein